MKAVIKMIVAAAVFAFALVLIAVTFIPQLGLIKNDDSSVSVDDSAVPNPIDSYSYDDGQFFSSVGDYLESLNISSAEDAAYDTSKIYHWAEEDVPNDARLVNIFVNEEGTVFNYYLERNYDTSLLTSPRDPVTNIIDIYPGYDLIDGLLHALIQKDYSLDASNITDTDDFVEKLAEDLGCEEDLVINYATRYTGPVYVRDHTSGTIPQVYLVGYQSITYTYVPNQPAHVVYVYMPDSLSETERLDFYNTMDYYINEDNICE